MDHLNMMSRQVLFLKMLGWSRGRFLSITILMAIRIWYWPQSGAHRSYLKIQIADSSIGRTNLALLILQVSGTAWLRVILTRTAIRILWQPIWEKTAIMKLGVMVSRSKFFTVTSTGISVWI